MTTNGNRPPEEIESEIEATRLRVDDTLEAIQDKLSPNQFMGKAMDYFRDSGTPDFFNELSETVKRNPIPLLMVGIGLAWLMMSGSNRTAPRQQMDEDDYDPEYQPRVKIYSEASSIDLAGNLTPGIEEQRDTGRL